MKTIDNRIARTLVLVVSLILSFPVFGQNADAVDLRLASRVGENFIRLNSNIALSGEPGSLRRVETDKFPNLYIFNADEHGWIIVAGDKRVQPILGFSDEGTFDPNDMAPAAEMIIGGYDYVVDSMVRYNVRSTDESVRQTWIDLENGYYREEKGDRNESQPQYVGPLITTLWHQGDNDNWEGNYNQFCPFTIDNNNHPVKRAVTGCDATAMGQLLYYYKTNVNNTQEYPFYHKSTKLFYNSEDNTSPPLESQSCSYIDNCVYNENIIRRYLTIDWDYSTSNTKELAATIMTDCAFAIHSRFGLQETSAFAKHDCQYLNSVIKAFQNIFGFQNATYKKVTKESINDDILTLKFHIAYNIPIYYRGSDINNNGHGYIIDGYYTTKDNRTFFHHNFGTKDAMGSQNYFAINDSGFNMKQAYILLTPLTIHDHIETVVKNWGQGFDYHCETNNKYYRVRKGNEMSITNSSTEYKIVYDKPGEYVLYDFDRIGNRNILIKVIILPDDMDGCYDSKTTCRKKTWGYNYTCGDKKYRFRLSPSETDYEGSKQFVKFHYDSISGAIDGKFTLTLTTEECFNPPINPPGGSGGTGGTGSQHCTADVSGLNRGQSGNKEGQTTNQIIYESVTKYHEYVNAMDDFLSRVLMEAYWFDEEKGIEFWNQFQSLLDSNSGLISEEGIQQLISQSQLEDISDDYIRFIAKGYNQSVLYWNEGYYTNDSLPEGYDGVIEYDTAAMRKAYEAQAYAESLGFSDVRQMYDNAYEMLETEIENIQSAVCARVTVQFTQKMTMTREAFNGTLQIFNGHESIPMEDILVDFRIEDQQGNNCTDLFQINTLALDQITGISGDGSLAAQTNGTALVQFIPTKNAAPTQPVVYSFGGSFSFIDPFTGEGLTYPLYPVEITVNPSPDLYVDYFMQRDILGDDALTLDVVEPSVPAELGVIIHNQGAGIAKNVLLETAEPQIIDNEKGLAIDFAMYGASFNGSPRQLGLMGISFGNIESGQTAVGEWLFTSSLLGHFISYEANVIHNSSYGNSDLSLVSHLDIHELIHPIYAYGNLDDGINDFLVNDNPDAYDMPDSIYFSHGGKTSVGVVDDINFDHLVSPSDTVVTLTVEPSRVGWNYGVTDDPGMNQYDIVSCIRNNDNQVIPLNNVWQTFVTIPDGGDPVYENKLHIVDTIPVQQTTTYTLVFAKKPSNLRIFHGSEDEYWSNAANWEGYIMPQADDEVLIDGICQLDEDAEVFSLTVAENQSLTIPENRILTVSGQLTSASVSRLIIEEGGQLFHGNTGVQATVQKTIMPYTEGQSDGWYLIAPPLAGITPVTSVTNLLSNTYDLYYYDEPTHYWMNQKYAPNNFTDLVNGKGYLYANSGEVLLEFPGELKNGSSSVCVLLNYTENIDLKGFNFVGNPFVYNLTSYASVNVANGCYQMNETKDDLIVSEISEENPLKPAEGFFVKALGEGASVTFNPGRGETANHSGSIRVELLDEGKLIDRLIVKIEGEPLEKMSLKEQRTKLFAMQDHQEIAIVPCEGNEQPVNFKAAKDGTYTINVNTNNLDFNYLHLIDNLTGVDVDLLALRQAQGPMSYTFEAKTTDYASRFRLVFSVCGDADDDDAPFAFINNGDIIVIGAEAGAVLQIVDVLGHVVRSGDAMNRVSTGGMAKGVYVLRLIEGEKVRTQKIVID